MRMRIGTGTDRIAQGAAPGQTSKCRRTRLNGQARHRSAPEKTYRERPLYYLPFLVTAPLFINATSRLHMLVCLEEVFPVGGGNCPGRTEQKAPTASVSACQQLSQVGDDLQQQVWKDERGKQHVRNSAEDPRLGLTCTETCAESQITKNCAGEEVFLKLRRAHSTPSALGKFSDADATINATSMSTTHTAWNPWSAGLYNTETTLYK